MDLVIKKYFDYYRGLERLPPEIEGKISGKLFSDKNTLDKWRSWRSSNLRYEDKNLNMLLFGVLDDCLVEDDRYIPLDYKTRGSDLSEDPRIYYQNQLDCYCLMLASSGYKICGFAHLLFYWLNEVKENGIVQFNIKPVKIETDAEKAKHIVKDAVNLLSSSLIPEPSSECEYCALVKNRQAEYLRLF